MNISSNKGMYLEEIINRTIDYYNKNNIGHFEKRNIPFKIVKSLSTSTFIGKFKEKSTVDYVGFYKNKHIEFEAKETNKNVFLMAMIKKHQLYYLERIEKNNGICFYIINFSSHNLFFLVFHKDLVGFLKSTITLDEIRKIGILIEITYPGIINFVKFLSI